MRNWNWKAIFGVLVLYSLTNELLALGVRKLFILLSHPLMVTRTSTSSGKIAALIVLYLVVLSTLALVESVVAGYLVAIWANMHKVAHALIVGLMYFVELACYGVFYHHHYSHRMHQPLWYRLTPFLNIIAIVLGAWWRVKTHGAESKPKHPKITPSGIPPIASP